MKILYIVPYVPSLIRVRPYNLIRFLGKRGHQVTVATHWSNEQEKQDIQELRQHCKDVQAVPISRWRSYANSALALPSRTPLQAEYSWSPAFAALLEKLTHIQEYDVIHVEHPVRGDSARAFLAGQLSSSGWSTDVDYIWENYNRNKRSVTIDISKEGGREIIYKFVEQADVFLTNLRPYEMERYHMKYDTLSQLNPRLIYGALTGLGKKGPERDTPGYDHTLF